MAWFNKTFGKRYQLLYPHRDVASAREEVAALTHALALPVGTRVLDACCGAGRHLKALVAAGFDARGADLSPDLLAEARRAPALRPRVVQADIRELPFHSEFDATLNLFTSLGYFEDDSENAAAVASLAHTLRPGGWLLVDHANREQTITTLTPEDTTERDGTVIHNTRWIDGDRVCKRTVLRWPDGEEEVYHERVRLYTPEEMQAMFASVGLVGIQQWGDFDGSPFTSGNPRMITVGKAPS